MNNCIGEKEEFSNGMRNLNNLIKELEPCKNEFISFYNGLNQKALDFRQSFSDLREKKKFKIAVVGRRDSGKETFLNTFIFKGEDILFKIHPFNLSSIISIKYCCRNLLKIEHYSTAEWNKIEDIKCHYLSEKEELIKNIIKDKEEVYEYVNKEPVLIKCDEVSDLCSALKKYLSSNEFMGFTIKNITFYVNNEFLRDIDIFYIPEIEDNLSNRIANVRELIQNVHTILYLSDSSNFFSKEDIRLFVKYIPRSWKGNFLPLASKCDKFLVENKFKNLDSINKDKDLYLKKRIQDTFDQYFNIMGNLNLQNVDLVSVFKNIELPIPISSVIYKMFIDENYKKNLDDKFEKFSSEELNKIANFDAITNKINDLKKCNEETILNVKDDVVLKNVTDIRRIMESFKDSLEKKIYILSNCSSLSYEQFEETTRTKIKDFYLDFDKVFKDINSFLENKQYETLRDIKVRIKEFSNMLQLTNSDISDNICNNNQRWYLPWKWRKKDITYDIKEEYEYFSIYYSIDGLKEFLENLSYFVESEFNKSIEENEIKRKLINAIVKEFNDSIGQEYLNSIIEVSINMIDFPKCNVTLEREFKDISFKFFMEKFQLEDVGKLIQDLIEILSKLYNLIEDKVAIEVYNFKNNMEQLKQNFYEQLLGNAEKELQNLKRVAGDANQVQSYKDMHNNILDIICKIKEYELQKTN